MKKTLGIAALVVAGALLAGCTAATPAPAREAKGAISKSIEGKEARGPVAKSSNTVNSVKVVEYPTPEGPSLMVTVQMTGRDDVPADALRQAVAESLAQASSDPSQIGLLFVFGEAFVDSQAAADELIPGVEFSSGGPILTGDQARSIVG